MQSEATCLSPHFDICWPMVTDPDGKHASKNRFLCRSRRSQYPLLPRENLRRHDPSANESHDEALSWQGRCLVRRFWKGPNSILSLPPHFVRDEPSRVAAAPSRISKREEQGVAASRRHRKGDDRRFLCSHLLPPSNENRSLSDASRKTGTRTVEYAVSHGGQSQRVTSDTRIRAEARPSSRPQR